MSSKLTKGSLPGTNPLFLQMEITSVHIHVHTNTGNYVKTEVDVVCVNRSTKKNETMKMALHIFCNHIYEKQ